jgi:hypothetical protein
MIRLGDGVEVGRWCNATHEPALPSWVSLDSLVNKVDKEMIMECAWCGKLSMDRVDGFCSTECKKESDLEFDKYLDKYNDYMTGYNVTFEKINKRKKGEDK